MSTFSITSSGLLTDTSRQSPRCIMTGLYQRALLAGEQFFRTLVAFVAMTRSHTVRRSLAPVTP
jgi:hypothetical protein